jgi:chromosome segregation ATPase
MALTMGISFAIQGLITLFDNLIHRSEKIQEAATDAKEKYNELQSEIDSLNSKIEENKRLINETNGSAEYDGYRKRLEAENKELERQIDLAKIKAQIENEEADKKAKKALTSEDYNYNPQEWTSSSGNSSTTTYDKGDIATATDWYLDQAEATGVVSDKLKDYIETIKEQRENLNLLNPESKKLYDNLGLLIDRYTALYPNIKTTSDEMETSSENADEMTVLLSELENASDGISSLSSAHKELSDNGYITAETITKIQEATKLSGDEWAEYETKLLNAKKGSAEFNQMMSELTYRIIENELATVDLTSATEEEIAAIESKITAILREQGVTNAGAVAQSAIARARALNAAGLTEVTYKTYKEIESLMLILYTPFISFPRISIASTSTKESSNTGLKLPTGKTIVLLSILTSVAISLFVMS